jgi:hypothetical protein
VIWKSGNAKCEANDAGERCKVKFAPRVAFFRPKWGCVKAATCALWVWGILSAKRVFGGWVVKIQIMKKHNALSYEEAGGCLLGGYCSDDR